MPLTDSQLLRAFADSSDEAAFAELVRRRLDFVYASALRQVGGDAHRAADVAQEVFVTLARKASALTRHPALLGWLCTATRFAAVDAIRSEQRRKLREQEASLMQQTENEGDADWSRLQPVLDAALTELPDRDREAVLARYFDRQSFAEIGRELGLSEDAAQKRVERALDKLRAVLARRDVTSTTAALGLVLWGALAVFAAVVVMRGSGSRPAVPAPAGFGPRHAVATALVVLGLFEWVGAASGASDPLQPLAHLVRGGDSAGAAVEGLRFQPVRSVAELDAALQSAGRPVMLDFYADWCVSCKEMERYTYTEAAVRERLSKALLLKADVTANNAQDRELLKRFQLFGPPGTIFFGPRGTEVAGSRVIGYQDGARFLQTLTAAGL
ncbi:MAG: sigma-70 family RNA polymerase sigma factor [Verrucomicrobiota bacterium]